MKIAIQIRLTPLNPQWSEGCKVIKTAGFNDIGGIGTEDYHLNLLGMRLGYCVMAFTIQGWRCPSSRQ